MNYKRLSPRYYQQRIPANRWWGRLIRWALDPVGLIGIVSLLILCASFYFAYHVHGYTSDEVVMQNALLYWKPFHHMTYFSDAGASYVDRIPLYWLVGHIFSAGRHALFVDGAILTIGNFILFYWSAVYLLKKAGLQLTYRTLTPFLWLSSFGYAVTEFFVGTNFHNIEVGIIFATCVLVLKIYYGEFLPLASWKSLALTILFSVVLGCTLVGDRYIFYYGLLPILILAAVGYMFKQQSTIRKRIGLIFGFIILGFAFAAVIQFLLSKSGILFMNGVGARTPQFVGYSSIYANLSSTIYNLFVLFGADFWGSNVLSVITIGAVINTVLLLLIASAVRVHAGPRIIRRLKSTDESLLIMSVLFLWSIFILTISSLGGAGTFHYLILLPFIGAVLLAGFIATTRGIGLQYMAALLLIATFLNIGAGYHYNKVPTDMRSNIFISYDQANGYNYSIVHALEAHNLTKGYGNYWAADITSYLSGGKVDIMPTLCEYDAKSFTYKWLMTSSQLSRPASQTFFLFDPHFQNPPNCPTDVVKTQFGPPSQIFSTNGVTVYIYDRNIILPYNVQ